jgi:hypothetical protein
LRKGVVLDAFLLVLAPTLAKWRATTNQQILLTLCLQLRRRVRDNLRERRRAPDGRQRLSANQDRSYRWHMLTSSLSGPLQITMN